MRRVSTCLGLPAILALGLPALAGATPLVTAGARFAPIAGFGGTGRLGAGAALEAKYAITGTELPGGLPSQLTKLTFSLPEGTKLHTQGFSTCAASVLVASGPSACPAKSIAGPIGAVGIADFSGGGVLSEEATLQAFVAPGGGLNFYANGRTPISVQIVAQGHFTAAGPPYGPELEVEVPLIEGPVGAPYASVTSIDFTVGTAYRQRGRRRSRKVFFVTLPRKCSNGGFPVKSELTFHSGETVTATSTAPCPKR
jgi:hypothetical protein